MSSTLKMGIVSIPQQFISDEVIKGAYIIDYMHKNHTSRQKVSFEYYTKLSLLITGAKEIYASTKSEKIVASLFLEVKRGIQPIEKNKFLE
jgi:hypothetical protein